MVYEKVLGARFINIDFKTTSFLFDFSSNENLIRVSNLIVFRILIIIIEMQRIIVLEIVLGWVDVREVRN